MTASRGVWMRLHKDGRYRLGRLMIVQDVSLRKLAKDVGVSHSFIYQLVKGERNSCKPERAVMIAKCLGVELSDLFVTELSSVSRQAKGAA